MCARTVLPSSLTLRRKPKPIPHLSTLCLDGWRASVSCWDLACQIWWEHEFTRVVLKECTLVHCMCGTIPVVLSLVSSTVQGVHQPVWTIGFSTAHVYGKWFLHLFNLLFVSAVPLFHSSILHYQNGCLSTSPHGTLHAVNFKGVIWGIKFECTLSCSITSRTQPP